MKHIYLSILLLFILATRLQAQVAGVTVNTIATSGTVVTVTTAAPHGLAVQQGMCLSFATPANVCGIVASATSTTLTFPQVSGSPAITCASSCGQTQAAKQIIILGINEPNATLIGVSFVFWLPTSQPLPVMANSQWTKASAAENNAIMQGWFIEQSGNYTLPSSLSLVTFKTILQAYYSAALASLQGNVQPGQFYGNFFNGAWTF
jgi:hypothetical protein